MENTFKQELARHIEILNLLSMGEDDYYQYKEMLKVIVEMTKELNHEVIDNEKGSRTWNK